MTPAGSPPGAVATKLQGHAGRALAGVLALARGVPVGLEVWHSLEDVRAMAHPGHYYAHKIRVATELGLFRATLDRAHHAAGGVELNRAAGAWRVYAATAVARYINPVWTNRGGTLDLRRNSGAVLYSGAEVGSDTLYPI